MTTQLQKLERLRRMGLAEIAGRTQQQAWRWLDRALAGAHRRRPAPSLTECARRLEAFRATASASFFSGATDELTPRLLADVMPEQAFELIGGADVILAGRYDLLGYRGLCFGDPVDWHLDPVSQRRAPFVHASRLDPLDASSVGDSKVIWELNRHQWLVTLGQAYQVSGDERYAEAFVAHLDSWRSANPVGWGLNWASSLEAALRLMAWCWALVLFRRSGALRPETFGQLSASIREHAAHVERYLSHYFSPNTHLSGEALGLFYAGTVLPDLGGARRWRERGAAILIRELDRQVLPDGVHFEQSTCYQRYTVEIGLHFLILAARDGMALPAAIGERVQAMLDFLLAVRSPRGQDPQIGDADGGWLLPLARRRPADLRGVFGVAAALFGRSDYAWAAAGAVPELAWMLGAAGLARFESIRPAPPAAASSRLFTQGGYAVMRDHWAADAHHLVFDVGPLGCPVSGGHGHADLLSIQCAAFGEPFVVDPGTGTYAEPAWRRFFRGTAAHSTVAVDGESQAVPGGPFVWRQRPRARLRRWLSTDTFDFADAEHDAYARLADPVRHRRRVLFVKRRYWVLVDDLEGAETHQVELRFQLGPVRAAREGDGWARATSGGRALLLRAFSTARLDLRVERGSAEPLGGWVSAGYGLRQPAPALVFSATTRLPVRIVTLLLPAADPRRTPPEVLPLVDKDSGLIGLVWSAAGEAVVEDGEGVLVRREERPGVS